VSNKEQMMALKIALTTWERDFLAEVKARTLAGKSVSAREKQIVLDLLRRENVAISQQARDAAAKEGLDVRGISTI